MKSIRLWFQVVLCLLAGCVVASAQAISVSSVQGIVQDWRAALSGRIQAGAWFNATTGIDRALTGTSTQRPNINGDPYASGQTAEQWLNTAAFSQPDLGTYGNEHVNDLLGPKNLQLDLAVSRVFPVQAGHRVEIRVEAFNILNLVNLANPVTSLNSPNFGRIHVGATGTATGALGQARTMQFAVRYIF